MVTGQPLQEVWCPTNGPIMAAGWTHAEQSGCKAFAFSCYDGSIQVYAQLTHEVGYLDDTAKGYPLTSSHSPTIRLLRSNKPMKVLWKLWQLTLSIAELPASVMELCKFGSWRMTVRHSSPNICSLADGQADSLTAIHMPPEKKPYTPRSVQFCDQGQVVIVAYMESHEV